MAVLGSPPAVERLVDALDAAECRPRRSGQGWLSLCPAHDDASPSLSIREGDDARALVHCFAGCTAGAVMAAVGLDIGALFDRRQEEPAPRPRPSAAAPPAPLPNAAALRGFEQRLHGSTEALELARRSKGWTPSVLAGLDIGWDGQRFTLPIRDERGELVNVSRYLPGGRPKMLAVPGRPRNLFPAPESIREALGVDTNGADVYVVEGEPDAVSAMACGLLAVAVPGSQGWRTGWAARFAGMNVRVLTDHDESGQLLAEQLCVDLPPHVQSLRRLSWPSVLGREPPSGFDLGDWLLERIGREK